MSYIDDVSFLFEAFFDRTGDTVFIFFYQYSHVVDYTRVAEKWLKKWLGIISHG